jgi:signal transduction histidine kinase
LASRLLLLASAEGPDFLQVAAVPIGDLMHDALGRWSRSRRRWAMGEMVDATVQGDRDGLLLALDALIENAVRHTAEDGRIELSTRREGANVVLVVADSGPGIPAGDVERIFNRFARIDSARSRATGGFGLGLAIVKAIAEAHGGSVRVHSSLGHGSTFELLLPESVAGDSDLADQPLGSPAVAGTAPSAVVVREQPAPQDIPPEPSPAVTPGSASSPPT